jgi:hypothetical protein
MVCEGTGYYVWQGPIVKGGRISIAAAYVMVSLWTEQKKILAVFLVLQ